MNGTVRSRLGVVDSDIIRQEDGSEYHAYALVDPETRRPIIPDQLLEGLEGQVVEIVIRIRSDVAVPDDLIRPRDRTALTQAEVVRRKIAPALPWRLARTSVVDAFHCRMTASLEEQRERDEDSARESGLLASGYSLD